MLLASVSVAGAQGTGSAISFPEAQAALLMHNAARQEVGVPPLHWSDKLAAVAQSWAVHLACNGCRMRHRPDTGAQAVPYGENLFWGPGAQFDAASASRAWYGEINKFTYGVLTAANWYGAGHYTQMIWRHTTQVGMGAARCPDGSWIIVANYDPAGNYLGQAPY
ncbi:CAP domain-containing protein [Flaviaesturariibacter amylovorans]|uniref:CAP domain-containing protein n=1 Tax=Flaviaesturariibacter amylovorans TaxID=1084520 RepID=A0ABP8G803_9BACT